MICCCVLLVTTNSVRAQESVVVILVSSVYVLQQYCVLYQTALYWMLRIVIKSHLFTISGQYVALLLSH